VLYLDVHRITEASAEDLASLQLSIAVDTGQDSAQSCLFEGNTTIKVPSLPHLASSTSAFTFCLLSDGAFCLTISLSDQSGAVISQEQQSMVVTSGD
jgi:hypothetical protein